MGTLACVTTGFEIVARNPELVVLPLFLDLFLWLGPRLSIAPVLSAVQEFLLQWQALTPAVAEAADGFRLAGQILEELSQSYNLFSLLHPAPLLGVPVLMPARLSALGPFGQQPAIEIAALLLLLVGAIGLIVIGLGLTAWYLCGLGREVIAETACPLPGPPSPWTLWRQFIKLGVLILMFGLSFSLLLSFFAGLIGLISFEFAGLVITLAAAMTLFIVLHLLFTIPGIVQLRRDTLRAMKESLLLTRGDFLNVLFLLGLIFVISQGLNVVWTLPDPSSWSTLVGLAGHAFVSTALTAGLFVFYQERLRFMQALQRLYAERLREPNNAHPVVGE